MNTSIVDRIVKTIENESRVGVGKGLYHSGEYDESIIKFLTECKISPKKISVLLGKTENEIKWFVRPDTVVKTKKSVSVLRKKVGTSKLKGKK